MAVAYIAEFQRLTREEFGSQVIQTPMEPIVAAEQVQAIGAASVTFPTNLNPLTRVIRFHCDAICHIAIGKSPVATANTRRLAANTTEYIGIPADAKGEWNIAVITGS